VGRKARQATEGGSRRLRAHIPDPIKRAVYERDCGRCTFADERGRAAAARLERWNSITWTALRARTGTMSTGLRLLCRAHNQHGGGTGLRTGLHGTSTCATPAC